MPRKAISKPTRKTERRAHATVAPRPQIGARALLKALSDAFVVIPVGAYQGQAPIRRTSNDGTGAIEQVPARTFSESFARRGPGRPATAAPKTESFGRAFRRARYFAARTIDPGGLAPTRAKVYKAIRSSGDDGLTSKQIKSVCRLPHGSVQQTLNWLRGHKLVKAAESNLD